MSGATAINKIHCPVQSGVHCPVHRTAKRSGAANGTPVGSAQSGAPARARIYRLLSTADCPVRLQTIQPLPSPPRAQVSSHHHENILTINRCMHNLQNINRASSTQWWSTVNSFDVMKMGRYHLILPLQAENYDM